MTDLSEYEIINKKKINSYTTNICILCSNLTYQIETLKCNNYKYELNIVYCNTCYHKQLDTIVNNIDIDIDIDIDINNKFNVKDNVFTEFIINRNLNKYTNILIISPNNILNDNFKNTNITNINKNSLSLIKIKFDIIIIQYTFEYLDNPIEFLNNCKKFMNKNTTIYIKTIIQKIPNPFIISFFNVNTMINISNKCELLLNFIHKEPDFVIYEIKNIEFQTKDTNVMNSLLLELNNNVYNYIMYNV